MKTPKKESVSEKSSCNSETENLQSESDSEDHGEDCLSKNTSPSKSNTSSDTRPRSDATFDSLPGIENTAIKLNLLSNSGDDSSEHPVLNILLPQTYEQSVLKDAVSRTSADCSELSSAGSHISTDGPVSNKDFPHTSEDFTVVNNAVPHSSSGRPVTSDSSTNFPVLNHATRHSIHEQPVENNSVADAPPESQVLNVPYYTFRDRSALRNPPPHAFSERPVLNMNISHTFPEHPVLNFTLYQHSFDRPVVNAILSHPFSELPVINITYPDTGLNDSLPTLFQDYPELTERPFLHVSLYVNYPESIALYGISHSSSNNLVLSITLSYFFQNPVFYNVFSRILPPESYLGQPNLRNAILYNFRGYPVLNSVLPQIANSNSAIFGGSFMEPSLGLQTYFTQPMALHQPSIPQFPSPANSYQPLDYSNNNFTNALYTSAGQRHLSQPFSNFPVFSAPAFSNQPAYLQPRAFYRQGYPIHYFPAQYNYFQFPQQICYPPQAGYPPQAELRQIQIERDADTDEEVHTDSDQEEYSDQEYSDSDQGIGTDSDQGTDTDQEAHADQ